MGNGIIRPSFLTFLSIQQSNLPDSGVVIAKAEEDANRIKAKGIPGLAEQVDIWLEVLRNEKEPDFEYGLALNLASGGVLRFARSELLDCQNIDCCARNRQSKELLTFRLLFHPSSLSGEHCASLFCTFPYISFQLYSMLKARILKCSP